jgi:hypothetical protein
LFIETIIKERSITFTSLMLLDFIQNAEERITPPAVVHSSLILSLFCLLFLTSSCSSIELYLGYLHELGAAVFLVE